MFVFRSHGVPQALTRAMTQSQSKGPEAVRAEQLVEGYRVIEEALAGGGEEFASIPPNPSSSARPYDSWASAGWRSYR